VPQQYHTRAILSRTHFLDAIERAALLARDGAIKISVAAGSITITANSPEVGDVYEELPATLYGEPLEIAFNSRYLSEGLKALDATDFVFEFSGPRNPSRLKATDSDAYIYIVLPLITY
jgi:DNA polymerase-3 subunit beta